MPVVSTRDIVRRAFDERYGVAAINVVNDLTMAAVLGAAERLQAPLIVQTSVKTVQMTGIEPLFAMWQAMAAKTTVPVALHLDHCPSRSVITDCLRAGWNSVLFDASSLPVEENKRQCVEVVAEAREYGALVEGEIEGFKRVEDEAENSDVTAQALDNVVDFIETTGVEIFAPAIGNAHGMYRAAPELDVERVSDIVTATNTPVALHGGTGMTPDQFRELISRGCAKVNISTALKIAFMAAGQDFLTENPGKYDPPAQFERQHAAVTEMAEHHIRLLGSEGKAW